MSQQPARFKNDVWTCDLDSRRTVGGRPLKWLTLVDEYTRELWCCTPSNIHHGAADVRQDRGPGDWSSADAGVGIRHARNGCEVHLGWKPWSTGCRVWGRRRIPVARGKPLGEWIYRIVSQVESACDEFLERVEFEIGGCQSEGVLVPARI